MCIENHTTVRLNRRLGTLEIDDIFFETTYISECEFHEPLQDPQEVVFEVIVKFTVEVVSRFR